MRRASTVAKGHSPWDRVDDASDGVGGHDGKTRRATRCDYHRIWGMHRILGNVG